MRYATQSLPNWKTWLNTCQSYLARWLIQWNWHRLMLLKMGSPPFRCGYQPLRAIRKYWTLLLMAFYLSSTVYCISSSVYCHIKHSSCWGSWGVRHVFTLKRRNLELRIFQRKGLRLTLKIRAPVGKLCSPLTPASAPFLSRSLIVSTSTLRINCYKLTN